jgi:transposase
VPHAFYKSKVERGEKRVYNFSMGKFFKQLDVWKRSYKVVIAVSVLSNIAEGSKQQNDSRIDQQQQKFKNLIRLQL